MTRRIPTIGLPIGLAAWSLASLLVALATVTAAPARANQIATDLADPRPSPATAVEVHGDELVVIAARQETVFDGTYKSSNGSSIEFKDGKPVSINIRDGEKPYKGEIDGVRIEDDKVVFGGDGNDILLGDGKFDLINPKTQSDPEPQGDPEPQPEPQPRPNPNAFEVRDGKVVTVWF